MLPPEGSVKDGRTIVYLERLSPSGSAADDPAGKSAKAGDAERGSSGGAGKKPPGASAAGKQKQDAKRATPSLKPLLPSSQQAAAKNQAAAMRAAAESGAPFCADCAEAHRLLEEASRTA